MISALIPAWPCGNKVPILGEEGEVPLQSQLALCASLNSFAFDFAARMRITGMNLNKFIVSEIPVPEISAMFPEVIIAAARLCLCHEIFAKAWIELSDLFPDLFKREWSDWWAISIADRLRYRAAIEAIVAVQYGLSESQFRWILRSCDEPAADLFTKQVRDRLPAKGFWRTGCGVYEGTGSRGWTIGPELRLTNLSIIAYVQLGLLIKEKNGNLAAAVKAFIPIAGDGGWDLPDKVTLSEYGLGRSLAGDCEASVKSFVAGLDGAKESNIPKRTWDDCRMYSERYDQFGSDAISTASAAPIGESGNAMAAVAPAQQLIDLEPQ